MGSSWDHTGRVTGDSGVWSGGSSMSTGNGGGTGGLNLGDHCASAMLVGQLDLWRMCLGTGQGQKATSVMSGPDM